MTRKSATRFSEQVMPYKIGMTRKSAKQISERVVPTIKEV